MARIRLDFPSDAVVFSHSVVVRIGDVNYWNHLGHDALVSLLHEARAQMFASAGLDEGNTEGMGCVVADLAVSYKAEARFGAMLKIDIARGEVERYGCELYYRVSCQDNGSLIALAKTGHVFFRDRKPVLAPIPSSFLRLLNP